VLEIPRLNLGIGHEMGLLLREAEEWGTHGEAVKCVDIMRNTKGEGTILGLS